MMMKTTHGAKKKDQNAPAKPHDLDTNPYSDESVAYRKYYSMDLPKPADFDVNPYSDEAIVYARFMIWELRNLMISIQTIYRSICSIS